MEREHRDHGERLGILRALRAAGPDVPAATTGNRTTYHVLKAWPEFPKSLIGGKTRGYRDFRELLDAKDIDAVVISTPDHWHALMTMLACAAGKDVYVEKPLTLFVREGRWMIDVARKSQRVVQVGTQQRSGPHYTRARELIQSGHIGKVVSVRMLSYLEGGNPAEAAAAATIMLVVALLAIVALDIIQRKVAKRG